MKNAIVLFVPALMLLACEGTLVNPDGGAFGSDVGFNEDGYRFNEDASELDVGGGRRDSGLSEGDASLDTPAAFDGGPHIDSGPDWVPSATTAGDPQFAHNAGSIRGACATSNPFGFTLGDWNNDGWPDMQVWAHGREHHCLWTNRGDGTFDVVSGWTEMTAPFFALGWNVQLGDLDGDGDLDAFGRTTEGRDGWVENTSVNPSAPSARLHNNGELWGHRSNPSFADIDGDGDLEVIDRGPVVYRLDDDSLLVTLGTSSASPLVFDVDGDGDTDILMPGGESYRNRGDGTFETFREEGLAGCAASRALIFDANLDGDLDVLCYAADPSRLWLVRNQDGHMVADAPLDIGFRTIADVASKAAHSVADYNNDGLVDVMILGRTRRYSNILLNRGDHWERLDPRVVLPGHDASGYSARPTSAPGDYDLDGRVDVITQQFDATADEPGSATLYRNESEEAGHFLQVILSAGELGNGGNRSAIGALVEALDPATNERVGTSYRAMRSFQQMIPDFAHLGTDTLTEVDLRVTWPASGGSEVIRGVRTNQRMILHYAAGGSRLTPWTPGDPR